MKRHALLDLLTERIQGGLKRRSLQSPSRWAESVRVMGRPYPGPWTFRYHPWLKEMHDSKALINVCQKAAQLGFTETVLNITFFKIDVESVDCLYILPSKNPDAGEFSAGRFDPALELSPHLSKLFSDVKNVGHKRAGSTNLYIRGSKSRSGLKSIPAGFLVLDEVDEMNQENISLARERMSGQKTKQEWLISTPTIDNYGINVYFNQSTQENYFFRCPSCSRFTHLIFPDCLEITAQSLDDTEAINHTYIKCKECHSKLPHETKHEWLKYNGRDDGTGVWIPQYSNRSSRGFHVNQLYSTTVSPAELAELYLRSLNSPTDEQIFWNNKIGVTHLVEGARLTEHQIESCKGSYLNFDSKIPSTSIITIGIDVGRHLHYEVDQWIIPTQFRSTDLNSECKVRVLEIGKVPNLEDLDLIMRKYRAHCAVIDANPDRRKSFDFASRFSGHVKMCFYGSGINNKQIHETASKSSGGGGYNNEPIITVNRTFWLDLSLGRFRNSSITIPSNTPFEYISHLKALIRVYDKDREGNPIGRYVRGNNDDHFAHARTYAEIALPFALHISNPTNIRAPI